MYKDYINDNSYKFKFYSIWNDKTMYLRKVIMHNRWDVVIYENDNDNRITDTTLKYAMQAVGIIHTIEFDNNGPIF